MLTKPYSLRRKKVHKKVENLCELLLGMARDMDWVLVTKRKGCALWRYFTYPGLDGVATSHGIKSHDWSVI